MKWAKGDRQQARKDTLPSRMPTLKAIRGKPRASARHGALQMPTLTSWLASQRKQGSCHVETDDAVWEAESSAIGLGLHAIDASLAVVVKEYGAGNNPRPRNFLMRTLACCVSQTNEFTFFVSETEYLKLPQ